MSAPWTAIVGSWGVVSIVIILGWYYYSKNGNPPKRIGKQQINGSIPEALSEVILKAKKPKRKDQKTADVSLEENNKATTESTASVKTKKSGSSKRKDAENNKSNKPAQSSSINLTPVTSNVVQKESDLDVKEFARQMTKAKDGTNFTNTAKDTTRVRTQKQSKINGSFGPDVVNGNNVYSSASSNTGEDADDDLSSVNSPGLPATTSPPDTTGISDMLETTGPGPASLRITEPLVPAKSKTQHVKKPEVVETKKQRQNRLKREREKEANRQAEAQRKVLEEKQRRTAREAEGRAAKNGNGWTYDSGLPANAWTTAGKPKQQPIAVPNGDLLDTMDDTPKATTSNVGKASSTGAKTNGTNGTVSKWDDNLPSEEEQMRLIQEQSEESEWTTVSQPKRNRRKQNTAA